MNCTTNLRNHFEDDGDVHYFRFCDLDVFTGRKPDGDDAHVDVTDIQGFFHRAFEFIDDAVGSGAHVLLHCVAGAHRAGTMGCAYLMHRDTSLGYQEAIAQCKARRSIVDPGMSPKLIELLERLQADHRGEGAPISHNTEQCHVDLDAEGHKLLEAQGLTLQ